MKNID